MKRFHYVTVGAVLAVSGLCLLVVAGQWPRAVFRCESFGCVGLGLVYLAGAAGFVVTSAALGALFGPPPRWSSGLFSGLVAAAGMLGVFAVLFVSNDIRIAEDTRAAEAACAEHPQLCPEAGSPRLPPPAPPGR